MGRGLGTHPVAQLGTAERLYLRTQSPPQRETRLAWGPRWVTDVKSSIKSPSRHST